jgi:hypothetical protein
MLADNFPDAAELIAADSARMSQNGRLRTPLK